MVRESLLNFDEQGIRLKIVNIVQVDAIGGWIYSEGTDQSIHNFDLPQS